MKTEINSSMPGWRNDNDPWVPLPCTNGKSEEEELNKKSTHDTLKFTSSLTSNSGFVLSKLPSDPLHQLIDSEKYIETLEKKLEKLKAKKKEPTSRDMITTLASFQEDQMKRYISSDATTSWTHESNISLFNPGNDDVHLAASSLLRRKLYPEQQAISAEELIELVKADAAAISYDQEEVSQPGRRKEEGKQDKCPANADSEIS